MLAVFDEPAVAVAAAIGAQHALDAAVWGDTGALRVRMVEYSPGYLADHWCAKGHILL